MVTEREIHRYISQYREGHGYSPSIREMCEATGIRSTSTMHRKLDRMRFLNMIVGGDRPRTVVPLPESEWRADA